MNLSPNHSLQDRQQKIQEKRKQTPWRNFVMEIVSQYNLMFYKNNGLISRFPSSDRTQSIKTPNDYLEELGDGSEGVDYQEGIPFFDQLQQVYYTTPRMSLIQYGENENCDYADTIFGAKNTYLSVCVGDSAENTMYSTMVYRNTTDIYNSVLITSNCSNIYYSKLVTDSYAVFFSRYIHNSSNIRFSDNLLGCTECISCSDLENQSYCINNKQYTKEDFFEEKKKILANKNSYEKLFSNVSIIANNKLAPECEGTGIQFCESIINGYLISRFQNGRNIGFSDGTPLSKDIYDCFDVGTCDNIYGWMGCGQGCSHIYCGANGTESNNIYYSYFIANCSFCLGCVGLKNKSYCIFNKQYTKEERYEKVDEIFSQMDRDGTLGQFFPPTMNPFYFNDTAAYLIDSSFTKEEVTAKGYLWRDEPIKVDIPIDAKVVKIGELENYEGWMVGTQFLASSTMDGKNPIPTDSQRYINPEILKVIIQDEQGNIYKIVKMEYDFLIKHGLPLPRKHWLDRMKENFKIN